MNIIFRYFFRTLRIVLGPIVLLLNRLLMPKPIVRSPEEQQAVDAQTRDMVLYQFRTCPFCLKVGRSLQHLSLNISTLDAQHDSEHRETLLRDGGKVQVPCLKVVDNNGNETWIYESSVIIEFLYARFGEQTEASRA